jgi:hypothetical protein
LTRVRYGPSYLASLPDGGVDRRNLEAPTLRPMRLRPISALVCAGFVVLGTRRSGTTRIRSACPATSLPCGGPVSEE